MNEISPISEKNSGKLQLFDESISLPEPKFYARIHCDCIIRHNVELCRQYFLQECLLLIRKSCN